MNDSPDNSSETRKSKSGFFQALRKTRSSISERLSSLVSKGRAFSPVELNELEDMLILADVGVEASSAIVDAARAAAKSKSSSDQPLNEAVREELLKILRGSERPLSLDATPSVLLMVGVNGVGKTTTAAKIANHFHQRGHLAMLAACDTFRAAAVEQLQIWGKRTGIPVIAHHTGSDPAAVAHDAMRAAIAKETSVLILDTAGRQHSRDDLMRQVEKINRVVSKIQPSAPHETLITIDATTGQNAISQVENFNRYVPLTGICVTKLDSSAKGGIVIALAKQFDLPIAYVGLGEKIDDLYEFQIDQYVDSLLSIT